MTGWDRVVLFWGSIALGIVIGAGTMFWLQEVERARERAAVEEALREDASTTRCAAEGDEFVCRWKREVAYER
jgi:hypothetical protein